MMLQDRVAIITGGASGIGKATASLFVAHGAKVIVADIQDELGEKVAAELGPRADYRHCDVTEEKDVAAVVDFAVSKHGCLDIMFNNAGVAGLGMGSVDELNMEEFDRMLLVNVRGALLGVKHAARAMIPARRGCILCTGSISGVVASGGGHPYTISKHAVVAIVKSSASELGRHGVRVNCISPSAIATPMLVEMFGKGQLGDTTTKAERLAKLFEEEGNLKGVRVEVEDIAQAALYLASDDGRCVSGHNLLVDGGYTIHRPWTTSLFTQ